MGLMQRKKTRKMIPALVHTEANRSSNTGTEKYRSSMLQVGQWEVETGICTDSCSQEFERCIRFQTRKVGKDSACERCRRQLDDGHAFMKRAGCIEGCADNGDMADLCGPGPQPAPSLAPSPTPAPATNAPVPTPQPATPTSPTATGPQCTKFDDCESPTLKCGADCTVSGNRPNCKCSNGCVWGVTCTRDWAVVAQWIFATDNHCNADGTCADGTKKAGSDYKERICMSYSDGKFFPENSGAGYCVGIYEKSYADFIVTTVKSTKADFEGAYAWSMKQTGFTPSETAPSRNDVQQCTDFGYCYGHGRASGSHGNCKCAGCEKFTGDRCDKWSWGPNSGTFTE